MRGRIENKIKVEASVQRKISDTPQYIDRFYHSLNNKTHKTKERYMNNVIRFLNYYTHGRGCPAESDLLDIDSYCIQIYMSEINYFDMNDEIHEMKEATQCNIYSCLSSFFNFLAREGYIKESPFSNGRIERPRVKENEVVYLTPEEVKTIERQILNGVGNQTSISKQKDWKYRDLLLFRIPVINGLRVTALSEIDIDDIDLRNKRIKVVEKGNITKFVDIDPKTVNLLSIWIAQREKLIGDDKSVRALFISNRRTRMTVRSIENIYKKYSGCIEGKKVTPHTGRRTCGTNTYSVSRDIYLTSKILGHKTTAPTRKYVAVLEEDKRDAIIDTAKLYN